MARMRGRIPGWPRGWSGRRLRHPRPTILRRSPSLPRNLTLTTGWRHRVSQAELAIHERKDTAIAEQFEDAEQQREASTLGMWIFLATEILFFGALFVAYTFYRVRW